LICILIVEDHALLRQSMAFMLEQELDFSIVRQAGSLAEARGRLKEVDIAIVDLKLPDGDGVELVRESCAVNPQGRVLVLTASVNRHHFARAVEAGAAGVINKSASMDEVIDAVRRLHRGELLLSPVEVVEMLRLVSQQRGQDRAAQAALGRLTPREREVLQALADGLSDKEIAQRLTVSGDTIRAHMSSILRKLCVESRLQALLFAARHGAVKIEMPNSSWSSTRPNS
jgi:two-component system nitrate/nitrite response regulator NarL